MLASPLLSSLMYLPVAVPRFKGSDHHTTHLFVLLLTMPVVPATDRFDNSCDAYFLYEVLLSGGQVSWILETQKICSGPSMFIPVTVLLYAI